MTRLKLLIAPFAIATGLAVPAQAQDSAIDIDGDGMYSLPEVQAVLPEMTEEDFMPLSARGAAKNMYKQSLGGFVWLSCITVIEFGAQPTHLS